MRSLLMMALLTVCGCGYDHEAGESMKLDLPSDCQKLDSVDAFLAGPNGNAVVYKAVCINSGMPVVYIRWKPEVVWAKHEFYFAAKPKTAPDAGARD